MRLSALRGVCGIAKSAVRSKQFHSSDDYVSQYLINSQVPQKDLAMRWNLLYALEAFQNPNAL